MLNANRREIEIQFAISAEGLPSAGRLRDWAGIALRDQGRQAELVIRVVDAAEMTALNRRYRHKDGPTNVLAFPCEPVPGADTGLLGDVVICAPLVAEEAIAQRKPLEAHWAHLVIHGVLHLLGYNHQDGTAAEEMEACEKRLLATLGYADPYR